jgi:diadenosine tetraphosphate (Ap4A) HIT family hydrolase
MSTVILEASGGTVLLPGKVLCDRFDGGHLIVNPPREVWERTELTVPELLSWSLLVAAVGQAMLEALPVLEGGCLNYWEAGNWALNDRAKPVGPKGPKEHRRVHLHVFGRSPRARHPDWQWGESPRFPAFVDSDEWSSRLAPLSFDEVDRIVEVLKGLLKTKFAM